MYNINSHHLYEKKEASKPMPDENNNNVFICSPLSGDIEKNRSIAECLCRLVCLLGKNPFAPHVYYTRFLDDNREEERNLGISQGIEWLKSCSEVLVFVPDNKITSGMKKEIDVAEKLGKKIIYFNIGEI